MTRSAGAAISIGAVWVLALAGCLVVVVGAAADGGADPMAAYGRLGFVLGLAVLAALVAQLATRRPEGFVARVSWSVAGALGIGALAALVLVPLVVT
ncbi:hypothetical protein [Agromyces sp. LHK192]|uniref:hypothetical protein n=1 Tax=Agromyces sp. LHK192 TaxID=2498704 RepID=UPI000FD79CDB|nr:hypothetical protein [Agromyces sp. LHK192]